MQINLVPLVTILGMAVVTYATRAGGLWLMDRVTPSARVSAWLRHIPGAVLVALIAPTVLGGSPAEVIAAGATILAAWRSGNLLLAMVVGVVCVWGLRLVI